MSKNRIFKLAELFAIKLGLGPSLSDKSEDQVLHQLMPQVLGSVKREFNNDLTKLKEAGLHNNSRMVHEVQAIIALMDELFAISEGVAEDAFRKLDKIINWFKSHQHDLQWLHDAMSKAMAKISKVPGGFPHLQQIIAYFERQIEKKRRDAPTMRPPRMVSEDLEGTKS
jgi:hypothetical protein